MSVYQSIYTDLTEMQVIHRKGFVITTYPIFESTEQRLARGDWQSKILGQSVFIRVDRDNNLLRDRVGKLWGTLALEGATHQSALEEAETRIDEFYARFN